MNTAVASTTPAPLNLYRSGTGEPLVLLHGMGESSIGWRPVIDRLSAEYDVIAIDLPGFGRSPALSARKPPTDENLGRAVEQTLDALGIGAYRIAGYSLGARVALQLAGTDRVRSVVAIGPDGLGTPLERAWGYLALLTGRCVAITLAPAADLLSLNPAGRSLFFAGNRALPWQLAPVDAARLLTDYADAPAFEATNWTGMFEMPTHLASVTQPVLFIQGTADPIGGQVMRYLPLLPQARLQLLPGLTHVPISDDPKAVADHMLTFLRTPAG